VQFAIGEIVKYGLASAALTHVSDIMQPHIPVKLALALEAVGKPACFEMLLQY
jgi:hypothetical protein